MQETPKGLRLHIAILGRRNAGKSTLLNTLARQQVSIVSPHAGTTTDPVEKTMELAPLGPVVFIDTAGMDDTGELGRQRIDRSRAIIARADMAILVTDGQEWGDAEKNLADTLLSQKIPFVVARNKIDSGAPLNESWQGFSILPAEVPVINTEVLHGKGIDKLLDALAALAGHDQAEKPLMSDLLPENGLALLVVPLDSGAPKGRLILPQVQAIRDCLDGERVCMICTDRQAASAISRLKPDLVVCDSQVARQAEALTPAEIPFTTFSILMARNKGNLEQFAAGAAALELLSSGDTVLIEEACSHHAQKDDIGRVKIPRLLKKMTGADLQFCHHQGKELAEYDDNIRAIVHCGACVITRRQMEARQQRAKEANIPMTNYGMAITLTQGILGRALKPFPEALAVWEKARLQHEKR